MLLFGPTLERIRNERRIHRELLAAGMKCSSAYIRSLEGGRRLPADREYVERLAKLCGTCPDELLEAFAHDRFVQSVRRIQDDLTPELSERIKAILLKPEGGEIEDRCEALAA